MILLPAADQKEIEERLRSTPHNPVGRAHVTAKYGHSMPGYEHHLRMLAPLQHRVPPHRWLLMDSELACQFISWLAVWPGRLARLLVR